MTGDFTRNSHRPDRRYSAVRMQQGRVLLDADWNEQSDIAADAARAEARDLIGPCGFPQDDAGFGLVPVPGDMAITPGRGYVGGMAAVNPPPAPVTLERVSGAGANTVWQVAAGPVLVVGQPLTPPDGDLSAAATVRTTAQGPDGRQQVTLSAAIGAADTVARAAAASLGAQPWLPGAPLPGKGEFLAYLEVWERPIGALEDPHLREIALGGPDTAQRLQTIWQVRLLDLAPLIAEGVVQAPPSCKSFPAGWRPDGGAAPALLAARAEAGSAASDPCALPAAGGYRSLENHLYRVEIHGGGTAGDGAVTMKWSRDNAMHRAALLNIDGAALVVDDAGRDDATGFAPGDWLEVLDEARVLDGRPGFMVKLGEVNGERLAVAQILDPDTLAPLLDGGAPDMAKLPTAGQVRRWEGGAPVPVASGWMPLENGVEVRLSKGALRCGDHWTIPARTVSADIDWPQDPSGAGPLALPPEGVIRRFCPLAIVFHDGAGGWKPGDDCRRMFPPLSAMESFDCLGGDGQEATPDLTKPTARVALGAPLRVGVARGAAPVQGRLVRFSVEDNAPAAALSAPPGADVVSATNARLILRTDAEGVAQALLALHPGRHAHTVTAELLDASVPAQADRAHLPIRFTATLSTAARTAYDPADCAYQQSPDIAPGTARTVQQALDKLCPAPTLRALGGDGQLLCAGKDAPAPLRVGAFWGKAPLPGVRIAFKVLSGDAKVDPEVAVTGPDGIAQAQLRAGDKPLADGGAVRLEASAQNPPAPMQPQALTLHARFANAACVYVDPDICPDGQTAAGEPTVAALLDHLCKSGGRDPGVHVVNVALNKPRDGQVTLAADSIVLPEELADGVVFELDAAADPAPFKRGPVGRMVFDMRYPLNPNDEQLGGPGTSLLRETEIFGAFELSDPQRILWRPGDQDTGIWLTKQFARVILDPMNLTAAPARAILHGGRIWAEGDPATLLDGDLFPDPARPGGIDYPSGDGRKGGDLVLHFRLGTRGDGGVVKPGLNLLPLTDGPLIGTLDAARRTALTDALAAGADRGALIAAAPETSSRFTLGMGRTDPAAARRALTRAAVGRAPLTVFAHADQEKALDVLIRQYAALGLTVEKRLTTAADARGAYRAMIARGAVDAVLLPSDVEETLRRDDATSARLLPAMRL